MEKKRVSKKVKDADRRKKGNQPLRILLDKNFRVIEELEGRIEKIRKQIEEEKREIIRTLKS